MEFEEVPERAVGAGYKKREPRDSRFDALQTELLRLLRFGRSCFARLERSQFLHQAALTTGSIIFVNDALFSSFIKRADGAKDSFLCFFRPFCECSASLVDGSTSRTTDVAVIQSAFLVLSISFDL